MGNTFGVQRVHATRGNIEVVVVALIVLQADTKGVIIQGLQAAQLVQKAKFQQVRARHLVVGVQMVSMQTDRATAFVRCALWVGG